MISFIDLESECSLWQRALALALALALAQLSRMHVCE